MSLLSGVFDGLFGPLTRSDRGLVRLIERGERLPGIIDAIRITAAGDGSEYWLGLRVKGPHGEFRAGVRQQLFLAYGEKARLGAEVVVLHLDGKVAVDWPETMRRAGVTLPGNPAVIAGKTTKEPFAPGIDDVHLEPKELAKRTRVGAEIVGVEPIVTLGMPTAEKHLDLRLADGRDLRLRKAYVPLYVQHLAHPGRRVVVALHPKTLERSLVDWALAAEEDAGIGRGVPA